MGFPRQECWSGLPFPSPGDLPDPGINLYLCVSCIGRWVLYHWVTRKAYSKTDHKKPEMWVVPWFLDISRSSPQIVGIIFPLIVQYLSCIWLFATPWTAAHQASLSFTISRSLLKPLSNESVMPSHPLLPPSSLALNQGLLQWVGSFLQVAKVLSFSFSISPSNEYSGMISFRID